jgi:uncharacterized protein YegL
MPKIEVSDSVFADNPNQRLPCVILLDSSGSMEGESIWALNDGLKILERELKADDIASQRVRLQVIRFGGDPEVEVVSDWTDASDFGAPTISASGTTPMGKAVRIALENIEVEKQRYKANGGIPYNRPWLFIITDGEPTDPDWLIAAEQARKAEDLGKVLIFTIGVQGANFDKLSKFSNRAPMVLKGLNFKELFVWISTNSRSGSRATPGSNMQLTSADAWGVIST